jgi:hypothetical protein
LQEGFGPLDVAIYGDDAGLSARVSEALGPPFRVTRFEELIALTSDLDRFHCVVMATLRPTDTDVEWMRRRAASQALSYVPLVLIHSSRPDTEAKLRGIALDDHIRPGEVGDELRPIARRLAVRVASANLIRDSSLPDILRRAFEIMCYNEPNPIQLKTVYAMGGLAKSSVYDAYVQWKHGRIGLQLEYVHEAIALCRCIGWKSPRRTWRDVAFLGRGSIDWIDNGLGRHTVLRRQELDDATIEDLLLRWLPMHLARSLGPSA